MGSDHRLIITHLSNHRSKAWKKFWCDKRWTSKSGLENIVQAGWTDSADEELSLHDHIKRCRSTIAQWQMKENYNTEKNSGRAER